MPKNPRTVRPSAADGPPPEPAPPAPEPPAPLPAPGVPGAAAPPGTGTPPRPPVPGVASREPVRPNRALISRWEIFHIQAGATSRGDIDAVFWGIGRINQVAGATLSWPAVPRTSGPPPMCSVPSRFPRLPQRPEPPGRTSSRLSSHRRSIPQAVRSSGR
jgi:hypothetical protein